MITKLNVRIMQPNESRGFATLQANGIGMDSLKSPQRYASYLATPAQRRKILPTETQGLIF